MEKGDDTGTVHLQFAVNFATPQRLSVFKGTKIHAEKVKRDNGVFDYCSKEETRLDGPWEFGHKPTRRNDKHDWAEVYEKAKSGDLDTVQPELLIKHYGNLKLIAKDNMQGKDSSDCRGVWISGPAGIGKSSYARDHWPDFYPKLANKWWDGYKGESAVILDDIDPTHSILSQQLKIWADRYGCILESKGGAIPSKFDTFVVTSQYEIEEVFTDQRAAEAIKRRFKEIKLTEEYVCRARKEDKEIEEMIEDIKDSDLE